MPPTSTSLASHREQQTCPLQWVVSCLLKIAVDCHGQWQSLCPFVLRRLTRFLADTHDSRLREVLARAQRVRQSTTPDDVGLFGVCFLRVCTPRPRSYGLRTVTLGLNNDPVAAEYYALHESTWLQNARNGHCAETQQVRMKNTEKPKKG